MKFKITASEKKTLLLRRKIKAAYNGKFETLLEQITVDDLVLAIESGEPKKDAATVKRVFESMLKNNIDEARDVFKAEVKNIVNYLESE